MCLCGVGFVMCIFALMGLLYGIELNGVIKKSKCTLVTINYDFLEGTNYDDYYWVGLTEALIEI